MKIVLLFFCAILGIVMFSILVLVLSTIRLNVEKIKISNFENGKKKEKIEKEFLIYLELYLFNRIKIAKIKLKKNLLDKVKVKTDIKELEKGAKTVKKLNKIGIIKKLKIKISNLKLDMYLGTEDIMITVFLTTFISTLISILLRNSNYKNINYNIMPLYQFGNTINFNLNCIIDVKMVHIIYVIYILLKKGMIKNERTSNRRSYDYSYE